MAEIKIVEVVIGNAGIEGYIPGAQTTLRSDVAAKLEKEGKLKILGEVKRTNKAAPVANTKSDQPDDEESEEDEPSKVDASKGGK